MTDLVMFSCTKINLRLSTRGCGKMWQAAQDTPPAPWEPKAVCQFCTIGAGHAGATMAPLAAIAADLKPICTRCRASGRRMIAGKFCVSCYNRHREARIGKNGKGTPPRKTCSDTLHGIALAVSQDAESKARHIQLVMTRTEAIIAVARAATTPIGIGVAPMGPIIAQWAAALEAGLAA